MCGIAGIYDRSGQPVQRPGLEAMAATLAHRGPDSSGVKSFGPVGLAHTRLAIIDLSPAGAQPMSNADESVWTVFNGEIYNFGELRADLAGRGCEFRSRTDTEVIVHLYEQEGVDGLHRLDGMFALAIWDTRAHRLVLARDRTGKKPLFIYDDGQRVVFASEIKAVLAAPGVEPRMRPGAVAEYLTYGYVPAPDTFYESLVQLSPGSWRIIEDAGNDPAQGYWSLPLPRETEPPSEANAAARVRELFTAAVERRLVSDVPLGAFLSGGVDSTLVVGVMAGLMDRPVRTFSIGFEGDDAYDETAWARQVADRFATDHVEFRVAPDQIEVIEKMTDIYDVPFADSSALPTYLLSELTRAEVTVALTGDGGDEVFAGYDRFVAARMAQAVPRPVGKAAAAASRALPDGSRERGLLRRAKRFLSGFQHDLLEGYRRWVSLFSPEEVSSLLGRTVTADQVAEPYRTSYALSAGADLTNQLLFANARSYLLDDLNVKTDRASMAHGLEARAPFLDTALLEYVFPLPGDYKLRGTTTKWLLKKAFADLLPDDIARRPKMGFGVPLGTWFRGGLREYLEARLRPTDASLYNVVQRTEVQRLLDEHFAEKRDRGQQLWSLLMLEQWLSRTRFAAS